uniref:SGNH hydrolase-type esterase domain-containing protein n=1 Tax=Tetradesmus obliquus TaxID=3088 RepID=A0A383V5K6_TETOB|eukprot:jgi/Sobl393_1/16029/SZX60009.1
MKWFEVFKQQWQDYHAGLQAVKIGDKSLLDLAAPLLLQNTTLVNPAQLRRSIGHMGGMHRLRRVLRDLQSGKQIKLGVLGGSISWGSAVERGTDDWFALLTAHLAAAFPAANVTGRNGCVPATPSSFMNMCLEQYLDEDVDLVFLEYAVNDGWDTHNVMKRKIYERLLRKVLSKPKHPAVILVQLPTVGMAYSSRHKDKTPFYKTVEDTYGSFAAYYDTPYLSMRNAIWRLAEHHHYQMNFTHFYGMSYDFVHPLEQGHRLIADMVLFAMQQALLDLQLHPWSVWDEEEAAAALPKPMYYGNWEEVNRLCTHGKAFEAVVTQSKGWQMVNEGDEFKPKFGYVTTQVGAELVITLNTTRRSAPELQRMNVQLAYLRSYTGLGMALVKCSGGCECQDTLVDGHHELRQSTIFLLRLYPTQAPACRISVTVQSESRSGGHKFKVTGVMANEFRSRGEHQHDEHEELNKEEWLGGVNKGEGELKERWGKAAAGALAAGSTSSSSSSGSGSSKSGSGPKASTD